MHVRWLWPSTATIAAVGYLMLPPLQQGVLYLVLSIAATALVLFVPGRRSDASSGWRIIGVGWLLIASGNTIWFWYEFVERTPPFPSVADVAYLSGYVAFAAGLQRLAHTVGRRDIGALIDATVVAIGTGVLAWVTLVTPSFGDGSVSLVVRLTSIAYPACDLLLLTLLLRLLFSGPARHHRALMLLALAFVTTLAADVGFAWTSLQGTYVSGHPIDVGWLLGYVLIGTAALHPSAGVVTPPEPEAALALLPRSRLLLLGAASLIAPALVINAGTRRAELDLVVVGTASAVLFVLVLWRMAGLVRQISLQAANLDALSTTDALTGVMNRRGWDTVLQTAVARAQRSREPIAVAMLDIDHFKRFNDTHGHPAGDSLLADAAAAWQTQLRPGDLLARIGGEEFALLLINCDGPAAAPVIERMRAATPRGETCSVGIAVLEPTDSPTELVSRADVALYQAKEAGRDRTVVAPPTSALTA
jgi:diguanylate cyclase (GGDEF)-like protein